MAKLWMCLLVELFSMLNAIDGYYMEGRSECIYSSSDLSDMVYIDSCIFNKIRYRWFNSTVGKYQGYTQHGIFNAERFNNDTAFMQRKREDINACKQNARNRYSAIIGKSVEPRIMVKSVKQSDASHPAMLMCSAYNFYPKFIKMTWLRNGKEVEGGLTSTEEMADGDWYYQVHSHLEYTPESGEEISCVVEHASFRKPMSYKWDPSAPASERSKIAIGASDKHEDIKISGCSESDKEYEIQHDEEEILHSDFKNQNLVINLPAFAEPILWPGGYEYSLSEQVICKHNYDIIMTYDKPETEDLDVPQNSIYPRDNVRLGTESTLICYSTRFFPPPVHISWTRNGVNVTDDSTLSQFYPNKDDTYNQFSHLPFTPQEGDVYTCTVEHKSLETPDTKTWGGYYNERRTQCIYSSRDLSDMVYVDTYIFNKIRYWWYNSTVGRFQGYTHLGIYNAERFNNDTVVLERVRNDMDGFCKHNAQLYYTAINDKSVEPEVEVKSVKQSDGSHPAVLVCSAYSFYPKLIKVTWMRNGREVEGDVTSTEEMADGDWYYQVHSHLEYTPESGEEISCVVEHASFSKPMSYKWDPSVLASERSKIAIGASGLVLGIVLSAAGFIYYKRKSSGPYWTRNGVNVTDDSTLSQFYPNEDGTYNQFSHLPFTPQEGDVYSCTVEHKALETPDTKTWDVDVELPSVGPAVFCGLGLAVGLLGVATGTFFLIKGNQCGFYYEMRTQCIHSSRDLSDMVLLHTQTFNKIRCFWFNSTVGKFQGYTQYGILVAEWFNNNTVNLESWRAAVNDVCKPNVQKYYPAIIDKSVEPEVEVKSVKQSYGSHPAVLVCSAYSFYPKLIKMTWLRNGREVQGGVTSTEEMADGDWYYQVHSHLEYTPESGQEISCVVEHASFNKPMVYKW
ncbi:MHC class II beta chain, partial [Clarias magur]